METNTIQIPPNRISDLVALKKRGAEVICRPSFEILPVDFAHRTHQFRAHIFLCRYSGSIDGEEFTFRKCYARGCPHNLCPHVFQAVMIANRHLQRDYHKLQESGVELEKRLFTLEDMVVKFDEVKEAFGPLLDIYECINIAKADKDATVDIVLEFVPGVEHFANHENQQVFLMADFTLSLKGKSHRSERCLACYEAEKEKQEKQQKIGIANERLRLLYAEFDQASIKHEKRFFE